MLFLNQNAFNFKFTFRTSFVKRFKSNLSVIFYGSSSFSLPTLKCLHSNLFLPDNDKNKLISNLDVCTTSVQNQVGTYSKANDLNLMLWPYELPIDKYDIGVVVSFGKLIPKKSIDSCKNGILNAHASLLPKLRGAAPIFRAILNDHKETGVTIMRIKPHKFDIGDMLLQEKVKINDDTKSMDLHDELSALGAKLLMQCLSNLDHYLQTSIPQNEQIASKANKIKPEECRIKWKEMDLRHVYKMYRAFDGFFPIYTQWSDGRELKLFKMINYDELIELQNEFNKEFKDDKFPPGTVKYSRRKKAICIKCKDKWSAFMELSMKGRSRISSKQFNNGYLLKYSQNKEIVLEN